MSASQRPARPNAGLHPRNQEEIGHSTKSGGSKQSKGSSNPSPLPMPSAGNINPKASGGRKSAVLGITGAAAVSGKTPSTQQSLKNASSVPGSGDKGLDAYQQEEEDKWYQQTELNHHHGAFTYLGYK